MASITKIKFPATWAHTMASRLACPKSKTGLVTPHEKVPRGRQACTIYYLCTSLCNYCLLFFNPYGPVLYAILASLFLASLFPKDQTVVIEVIKGFVLLAKPTEWSIFRDYYAFHVVLIVVPCGGRYKKCHITSAEPRNYLPYPTIWSIIK